MATDIDFLLSQTSSLTPLPRRPETWTYEETTTFLAFWSEEKTQEKLLSMARNKTIWEDISSKMTEHGYNRTGQQCKSRLHNLTQKYKKCKDANNKSGNSRQSFDFYNQIDEVLGGRPSIQPDVLVASLETVHGSSTAASLPAATTWTAESSPAPSGETTQASVGEASRCSSNTSKKASTGIGKRKPEKSSTVEEIFNKMSKMLEDSEKRFMEAEARRMEFEREQEEKRREMEERMMMKILEKL